MFDEGNPFQFHVDTQVDVDRLIDNNRQLAEEHKPFSTNKLLARVPLTVYEQSVHENWDEDDWKKWLNNPDNAVFRVWKGKV